MPTAIRKRRSARIPACLTTIKAAFDAIIKVTAYHCCFFDGLLVGILGAAPRFRKMSGAFGSYVSEQSDQIACEHDYPGDRHKLGSFGVLELDRRHARDSKPTARRPMSQGKIRSRRLDPV